MIKKPFSKPHDPFGDDFSLDGYEIQDPRVDDIVPVIRAMEFLKDEAIRTNNVCIAEVIRSSYRMVTLAYDLIKKDYGSFGEN